LGGDKLIAGVVSFAKPEIPHMWLRIWGGGGSAIDGRTTRHTGYGVSQWIRKKVEEIFAWMKAIGGFRKTRYKGVRRTHLAGWFVGAAYNLLRLAKLMPDQAVA
jgi:hypothetical protein